MFVLSKGGGGRGLKKFEIAKCFITKNDIFVCLDQSIILIVTMLIPNSLVFSSTIDDSKLLSNNTRTY